MEATPDTSGYMVAGYIIAFLVMGLYVLNLYLRHRSLSRDLEALETVITESKPKPALKRPAKAKRLNKK